MFTGTPDRPRLSIRERHNGFFTPFALTSQVTNVATWTPQVLQQRQQESLAVVARLWGLQPQP